MGLRRTATAALLALLCIPAAAAAKPIKPSAVLQAQPADATQPVPEPAHKKVHKPKVPNADKLKNGKNKAPSGGGAGGPAPQAVVVGGLNQPGLGATNNSAANQGTPPDTTGAIGPQHYVEFVNSKVGVYDRDDLSLVTSRDLDAFTGRAGQDVFDPQIQWDQQANRWLYLSADVDSLNRDFLNFGWSKTADPTDLVNGWCRFAVSTDNGSIKILEDYPKLGHDNLHVIFGTNSFRGNTFLTSHVFSLPKPANGDTSCATPTVSVFGSSASPLTTSDGTFVFTPVPANTADASAAGFVVAADSPLVVSTPSQIMAWHVGGSGGSPTLVPDGNMNVTAYNLPLNVPQPGTSNVIDSSDGRLTQAVAHADPSAGGAMAVWTQHTVNGPGNRSIARWYELLPASLTVRQAGTIQNASQFVFNAAISPAFDGTTAAINYNTGSASQLVDIRAQTRLGTTPLGQMSGEFVLGTSSANDIDFSCTPCRWGDYAGASPDPASFQGIWGSNQLNGPHTSDPAWLTRNFQLTDVAAGYARPKGASPLRVSLVPAFTACVAGNRTHGAPLSFPSCAPPDQASSFLTVGTPDANGATANAIASVRFDAILGDPGTPANEADVRLRASATDVRLQSTLADYTGELDARAKLQITDSADSAGDVAATGPVVSQPLVYRFAVPCQSTASTSVGGSCAVDTTANAITPGTVTESKRTIWELDQVQLFDGGADGVASTNPNTLFETQGVFVP
jgi:hypothetical protein